MVEVVVIGSLNMDLSVKVSHIPVPGETLTGGDLVSNAGGKGANQAVACARLGRSVAMLGKVGNDGFGQQMVANLKSQGVDTTNILTSKTAASGTAMIMVDEKGENIIVVSPGANGELLPEDLKIFETMIASSSFVLLQLEIPLITIQEVVTIAKNCHVPVLLNPAPAQSLPDSIYQYLDYIVPNETEVRILTGLTVVDEVTASAAAELLLQKGVKNVIITLGSKGAFVSGQGKNQMVSALRVSAIDTTAAGDAFIGGFVSAQVEGLELVESVRFACCVGALAATKYGAQSSLPSLKEALAVFSPEGGSTGQ